jgi:RNA polymerase sigma factor (sigma-70 family)
MFTQATLRCSLITNHRARGGGQHDALPFPRPAARPAPRTATRVHHCVDQCRPHIAPRPYTSDWHEELYHEAAYAACLAEATYDPDRGGSLYQWGVRVIGQHLKRFCDRVWASAKRECDPPCDEETGEAVEYEDPTAQEPFAACLFACALRQALQSLSPPDRQVAAWHLLEGLTERAIAQRLGVSQRAVHKRLERIYAHLRQQLDG